MYSRWFPLSCNLFCGFVLSGVLCFVAVFFVGVPDVGGLLSWVWLCGLLFVVFFVVPTSWVWNLVGVLVGVRVCDVGVRPVVGWNMFVGWGG